MKIGMIGAGMVAGAHLSNLIKDKRVKVKWICDVSRQAVKERQQAYGIPQGTARYQEILADPEVKGVVICTPPWLHAQMTVDAIRAGKHVLLEKPLAATRPDINRIVREVKKYPRVKVCECSCRHSRLQPKYPFIQKLIASGQLGRIYFIHHNAVGQQARPGIEYNPKATWFVNRKMAGGGPLTDWGVYDLSFLLGVLGDKPRLKKMISLTQNRLDEKYKKVPIFDVEEHGVAMLEFNTGLKVYYERGSNAHNQVPTETRIYGTKGGLKFRYLCIQGDNEIEYYYIDQKGRGKAKKKTLKVSLAKHPNEFAPLSRHFVNVLLGKDKPAIPVELAAKHLDIILKIYDQANKK